MALEKSVYLDLIPKELRELLVGLFKLNLDLLDGVQSKDLTDNISSIYAAVEGITKVPEEARAAIKSREASKALSLLVVDHVHDIVAKVNEISKKK